MLIKNDKYEILTPFGFKSFDGISKTPAQAGVILHLSNGHKFKCACNHLLMTDVGFKPAVDLYKKTVLFTGLNVTVDLIENTYDEFYDAIQVDTTDHSYVSSNLISHNCEFIGSISTLIDHTFLKEMKAVTPLVISRLPSYIKVWQLPLPKERLERENWEYVASLDTGYGVHMDSTVLQLCLVKSNITIHQVAKMYSNSMDVELFCKRARELLKSYHDPSLIIEQNGPGAVATTWFHSTAEYEGLLHFDGGVRHMGLWATDKMKENAVILIKAYIQRGFLKISDIDTMDELKSFGRVGVNKWGAMGGNHDDHVTSLYWIPYYLNTQLFYGNIIDVNLQQLMDDEIILGVHKDEEDDKRLHTERNGPISNMSKIMEDATKYMDRNRFYNVPSPFDKYGNDNDSSVSVFKL